MSLKKIKFGDKEVDKKEFYSSKQAIPLDSVDLDKIVFSSKWKINETTYKYLCGYLNNDVIEPLCVKYFVLTMAAEIWHLLRIMKKFTTSIMKYGK